MTAMTWNLNTAALLIPLLFLPVGLTITVVIDPYISRKHRRVMLVIIVLSFTLIVQNIWEDYLSAGELRWFLRTTLVVYGYTLRPVFLILFLYIVRPERKYPACWGLAILNCAIHLTAFFSHLCFWIDEFNHYQGGPPSNACLVISLILMAYWLWLSARNYRASRRKDILIPLLVVLIILVSVFLDGHAGYLEQPITFLTFGVVSSSVFCYIWLHMRFVQDHEADLKARQRMQIMLSQIQPHFLYNTLSAIQYLCGHDPKAAGDITAKFSRYLQGNMSALKDDGEIPFKQELEHTRIYLEIEKVRYEDALQIEYDIACTDFSLPTLTLQPIVENAVRHGARGKRGAGTVTLATREYPEHYEITVTDDGPGFDPKAPALADDGRDHIGIPNVRDRLEQVSGGVLRIRSEPGKGTVVTMEIPKKQGAAPACHSPGHGGLRLLPDAGGGHGGGQRLRRDVHAGIQLG